MSTFGKEVAGLLVMLLTLVLLSGCTVKHKLQITEVSPAFSAVELYLDKQPDQSLPLATYTLEVRSEAGHRESIELFGSLSGEEYLIVWEDSGYAGPPMEEPFQSPSGAQVRGIKVPSGFLGFDVNVPATGFALRVFGERGSLVKHNVDDVLKFGPSPRPSIGGSFTEDMPVPWPPPLGSFSRKWDTGAPVDNNKESDWELAFPSLGAATP